MKPFQAILLLLFIGIAKIADGTEQVFDQVLFNDPRNMVFRLTRLDTRNGLDRENWGIRNQWLHRLD